MPIFSSLAPVLVIAGLVASSVTGVGPSAHHDHADAVASDRTVVAASSTVPPTASVKYSNSDIIEFFVWGRGPAAMARPDLLGDLGITPQRAPSAALLATAVADFKAIDPNFHAGVTLALQTHDPYKAESGIKEFSTDIQALVSEAQNASTSRSLVAAGAVPDGSVSGSSNYYLFTNFAVSLEVAVAGAAVVSIAVVFLAFYKKPADQSDLIAQTYADALVQL